MEKEGDLIEIGDDLFLLKPSNEVDQLITPVLAVFSVERHDRRTGVKRLARPRTDRLVETKALLPVLPIASRHPLIVEVDDVGMRPVVGVEDYRLAAPAWEIRRELENVADRGATKTVNGLILVTDHTDVGPLAAELEQNALLDRIRILILVDDEVRELLLQLLQHLRIRVDQRKHLRLNGREIDCVLLDQDLLIGPIDFTKRHDFRLVSRQQRFGVDRLLAHLIDKAADRVRLGPVRLFRRDKIQIRQGLEPLVEIAVDGILLVKVIESLVVLLEPRELGIVLQHPQEDRMHRTDVHFVQRNLQPLFGHAVRNARNQFRCSLLGKGRDEDVLRRDLMSRNQVDDTFDNRHRLARTGPGNHQERSVDMLDDLLLLRINVSLSHNLVSPATTTESASPSAAKKEACLVRDISSEARPSARLGNTKNGHAERVHSKA